jgi:hypothetical protein
MKIKTRIIGIGLALMLIISLVAIAVPAAAAPPGDMVWIEQSKPGAGAAVISNNADVTDWAQCVSTGKVYIANDTATTATTILKSGASGTVWGTITALAAWNPSSIAVAPDNDNSIAVADNVSNTIYISNDGGTNWSTLPALPAGTKVLDVDISPARSNTLLGREYAVALADPLAGTATGGVYILGATASWTNVGATVTLGDFYTVKFSPGYLGDRVLVALSSNAGGQVGYWLLNTSTNAAITGYAPKVIVTAVAANDFGFAVAPVKTLSLALPSDFDPTAAPVAYVGIGSVTPVVGDDVYRLTATSAVDLNAVNPTGATAFLGVDSVGFAGTQSEGTLFCGYVSAALTYVKRTAAPTSNAPTWSTSANNPTGSTLCLVNASYDFASSNMVFVGTMGAESAWSISDDGGVSFYGRSMIHNMSGRSDWGQIEGWAVTPDGSSLYLVTDDSANLHVWYSPMPPSSMSAKRMYTAVGQGDNATTRASIKLNPDWDSSPTIVVLNPSAATDLFYISNNAGATWSTRVAPAAVAVGSWGLADKSTFYATLGANFYKTTNQAWTWEAAVAAGTTAGDMVVAGDGTIFIAGTSVRKSSNGGATWAGVGTYGASGNQLVALPDTSYDDNGIVYTADKTTGDVMRLDVATSTWRSIANNKLGGNGTLGLQLVGGNLYFYSPGGVEMRTSPTVGTAGLWTTINTGLAAPALGNFNAMVMDPNTNTLLGVSSNGDTVFDDIFGIIISAPALKPTITSPVSGFEVAIDPVNGRGVPFTIVVAAIGDGQGAINQWDYRIYDKAAGVGTATIALAQTGTSKLTSALGAPWTGMLPNTTYVLQIRGAQTASGQAIKTLWSDPVEVTVQAGTPVTQTYAGPQILGPQGGGTTGLNPGFAWAPVAGATKYQFIVATDAALTKTIGGTPVVVTTPSFQVMGLDYGTTYFWAVKVLEPTPGVQTISTFSTMDEPAAAVDPGTTTPPVVVPTQPVPDIIVNVPDQTDGGTISATAIWAVIGIGAVLIVAVLVLIVRTRRPV